MGGILLLALQFAFHPVASAAPLSTAEVVKAFCDSLNGRLDLEALRCNLPKVPSPICKSKVIDLASCSGFRSNGGQGSFGIVAVKIPDGTQGEYFAWDKLGLKDSFCSIRLQCLNSVWRNSRALYPDTPQCGCYANFKEGHSGFQLPEAGE